MRRRSAGVMSMMSRVRLPPAPPAASPVRSVAPVAMCHLLADAPRFPLQCTTAGAMVTRRLHSIAVAFGEDKQTRRPRTRVRAGRRRLNMGSLQLTGWSLVVGAAGALLLGLHVTADEPLRRRRVHVQLVG